MLALREDLLTEKPETIKNSVTYDFSSDDIPKKVTLRELCKVLKIFSTVSTKYVLLTVCISGVIIALPDELIMLFLE